MQLKYSTSKVLIRPLNKLLSFATIRRSLCNQHLKEDEQLIIFGSIYIFIKMLEYNPT
jgi:hypothetical protein